MLFSKTQHGWRLMRQSLKMFKGQKKLLILPTIGRGCFFLVFTACLVLIWAVRSEVIDYHQLSTAEILWGYLIILIALFLANLTATYFNAALTACLIQLEQQQKPQLLQGVKIAAKRLWQIIGWIVLHFTFGLVVMLFPHKFKKNRLLSGLSWSFASFFVSQLLINEPDKLFATIKRSSQLVKTHCGDKPKINFSLTWILLIIRAIAFIPAIIAYSTRDKTWIILGLIATAGIILLVMIIHNAISVVTSQAIYQYVSHKKVIGDFNARDLSTAISG